MQIWLFLHLPRNGTLNTDLELYLKGRWTFIQFACQKLAMKSDMKKSLWFIHT